MSTKDDKIQFLSPFEPVQTKGVERHALPLLLWFGFYSYVYSYISEGGGIWIRRLLRRRVISATCIRATARSRAPNSSALSVSDCACASSSWARRRAASARAPSISSACSPVSASTVHLFLDTS